MSDFGQGSMLLRSIIENKSYKDFSKLKSRLFINDEKKLFSFMRKYVSTFGCLPSVNTCRVEGFDLPAIYEPIAYYKKRVTDRYVRLNIADKLSSEELLKTSDPDEAIDIVNSFMKDISSLDIKDRTKSAFEVIGESAEEVLKYRGIAGLIGIATGWDIMDKATSGLRGADFVGIIGYTNVGKTFILLDWVIKFQKSGINVLVVSMEMPLSDLGDRYIAKAAGISYEAIVNSKISTKAEKRIQDLKDELKAVDNLTFVKGNFDYTVDDLQLDIENYKPDVVAIDGISLMKPDGSIATQKMNVYEQERVTFNKIKSIISDRKIVCVYTDQAKEEEKNARKKSGPFIKGSGLDNVAGTKEKIRTSDAVMIVYKNPSNPNEEIIAKLAKVRRGIAGREYLIKKNKKMQFQCVKELNTEDIADDNDEEFIDEVF